MKLTKYKNNPILSPTPENEWENMVTSNPTAWYEDGKFTLFYRAAGAEDIEHKVYIGVAESDDGFNFKRVTDHPVLSPTEGGFDAGCVEDPRIVKFGENFYMTYAFRPYPPGQYWKYEYDAVVSPEADNEDAPRSLRLNIANSALAVSKDLRTFKKLGRITPPSIDDRDVILFPEKIGGRYYMLHRPKDYIGARYGVEHPSIWIKSSSDLMSWDEEPSSVLMSGNGGWEIKIGGNTPPIRTNEGWLMLYHGVDDKFVYRIGAAILDIDDPTKVLYRTQDFIMEPESEIEKCGLYKWGVVFPCGNVVVDGVLYVYYGASDQYCSVATANLDELLDFIKTNSK